MRRGPILFRRKCVVGFWNRTPNQSIRNLHNPGKHKPHKTNKSQECYKISTEYINFMFIVFVLNHFFALWKLRNSHCLNNYFMVLFVWIPTDGSQWYLMEEFRLFSVFYQDPWFESWRKFLVYPWTFFLLSFFFFFFLNIDI